MLSRDSTAAPNSETCHFTLSAPESLGKFGRKLRDYTVHWEDN